MSLPWCIAKVTYMTRSSPNGPVAFLCVLGWTEATIAPENSSWRLLMGHGGAQADVPKLKKKRSIRCSKAFVRNGHRAILWEVSAVQYRQCFRNGDDENDAMIDVDGEAELV